MCFEIDQNIRTKYSVYFCCLYVRKYNYTTPKKLISYFQYIKPVYILQVAGIIGLPYKPHTIIYTINDTDVENI